MKLTWLGHACFLLEEQGYRIVLDPYEGVAGYPPLHTAAHAVFCSHHHFDHDAAAGQGFPLRGAGGAGLP